MIKNLNKIYWTGISIISPECNLDCSYCALAKAKKTSVCVDDGNQYFKDCIKSIQSGEYLSNVKALFERYEQNFFNIQLFEIWGQEPTLILPTLIPKWEEWANTFPNIQTISFSTNGVANMEYIADFIEAVEKNTTKNVIVDFQVSYDGSYGQTVARGYSQNPNNILDNCIKFINKLNQIKLNKVTVYMHLHTVLSTQLMRQLSDEEQIMMFLSEYDSAIHQLQSHVINNHLILPMHELLVQNCGEFTAGYGLELEKFIKLLTRIRENAPYEFFKGWENVPLTKLLFGVMSQDVVELVAHSPYQSLDEYIDAIMNNKNSYLVHSMCGSIIHGLKVSHEGCVYDCHGSIYDNLIDETKLEQNIFDQTRWQCTKHNRQLNFLTCSDQEAEDAINFYAQARDPSIFFFMFHNLVNQIYLLSVAGQADRDYQYNFQKLKRHAFILARNNQCFHGLKLMNGSIFLRGNEEIRQICNGAMDHVEKYINMEIQAIKHHQQQCKGECNFE